jgi:hypothetical protein
MTRIGASAEATPPCRRGPPVKRPGAAGIGLEYDKFMTNTSPNIYRPAERARSIKVCWLVVFSAGALLYVLTAQQGVSWQDSGSFQWRAIVGDYEGDLGLALAHPLYIAAGQALHAAFGPALPAALNAFSGIGMAVALANLAGLLMQITGRRWIALAIPAVAGVAHTAWWLGTIAEVYTWTAAGLTAELWLLVSLLHRPRWQTLSALALVSGLGWSLHNFALLPLPVYLVAAGWLVASRRLRAKALAPAAGAYLAGAAPLLVMIVAEAFESGPVAAVLSALFGDYRDAVLSSGGGSFFKANAALTAMNFVNLLLPLAIVGWLSLPRLGKPAAAALAAITIIELLFFVRYPVPDQFTFFLPSLMVISLAAGLGADRLARKGRNWAAVVLGLCLLSLAGGPALYAAAPSLARRAGVAPQRARALPFRDEVRYWLVPWKHNEDSAQQFARAALGQVQPGSTIIADETSAYPLRLAKRLAGARPDVTILNPQQADDVTSLRGLAGAGRLYTVANVWPYVPTVIVEKFELVRDGVLFAAYPLPQPRLRPTTSPASQGGTDEAAGASSVTRTEG